jgi:N-acetylmuramoyl-L-alanine amidase
MKKPILWVLDAGHGGIDPITDKYVTPGKRSPEEMGEPQIFEGVYNLQIVNAIAELMRGDSTFGRPYLTRTNYDDTSIGLRNAFIKKINRSQYRPVVISVHLNAGGGTGFEVFTSPGKTSSDTLAECFCDAFVAAFPDKKLRTDMSDGDRDKEANFGILTGHPFPAVLTENFFMDNASDLELLRRPSTILDIAAYHIEAMKAFEKLY